MRADYAPEYSRQASTCSASPETSGIARKRRDLPQQVGRLGRLAEPDPVTGTYAQETSEYLRFRGEFDSFVSLMPVEAYSPPSRKGPAP